MYSSKGISYDKAFKQLEWILFIGLTFVAIWFGSGVIEHFLSNQTSFVHYEEEITKYPVVAIKFHKRQASEVNETNAVIYYKMKANSTYQILKLGENHLHNGKTNETDVVILDSLEDSKGKRVFRIMHSTPISKLDKDRPNGNIKLYTKFEEKLGVNNKSTPDPINVYVTSQENCPGFIHKIWRDGMPLQPVMRKNTKMVYNLQPKMTKYLKQLGECQKEAYYECIASKIDTIDFKRCSNKCIPNVFSNIGKNYSTAFCQNDTFNQQCMFKHMFEHEVEYNCKKACSSLEYFGEKLYVTERVDGRGFKEKWNMYFFQYKLINLEFAAKVYEEYLVYDEIGMIGSVGGTLGTNYLMDCCMNCVSILLSNIFSF